MKVQIHKLFDYLLSTTAEVPECVLGFSLSKSPRLRDFMADLDPNLSLDWNGLSFQGLPALRDRVIAQAGLAGLALYVPAGRTALAAASAGVASLLGYAHAGVRPEVMGIGPVPAVENLLKRTGLKITDFDVIESNEAFAAQSLACIRSWGLADDDIRINPNGGAIALGHPLGMSGARILNSAAIELQEKNKRYALVTMCIGVGQGYAVIIEKC